MADAALLPELDSDDLRAELASLRALTDEQLVEGIQKSIRVTVDGIHTTAMHLRVLTERGKDVDWLVERNNLTDMEVGYLRGLRMIAFGQMLPEVLLYYLDKPRVAELVGALPLSEQQKLVAGQLIPLRELGPAGEKTVRHVNPRRIPNHLLTQLFAPDGALRDLVEQDIWLAAERNRKVSGLVADDLRIGKWRVDKAKGGAWLNGKFYPQSQLEAVVKALRD